MGPHALTAKRLAHHNGARLQSNTHTINKKKEQNELIALISVGTEEAKDNIL